MTTYLPQNIKEFASWTRQRYPFPRRGFRPAAYVVLTRDSDVTLEVSND